jgi:hypothetical protein
MNSSWAVFYFLFQALSHSYFSRAPNACQPSDLQLPVRLIAQQPHTDCPMDVSDDVQQPDYKRMKF